MEKKLSSNKKWFTVWALYHGLIIAAFAVSVFFTKGIIFSSDFTQMMPSSSKNPASKIADRAVSSNSSNTVFILSSHKDFNRAKEGAEQAYTLLKDEKTKFNSVNLYTDNEAVADVKEFIARNRFYLLDKKTQSQLNTEEGARAFALSSLEDVYSGFSLTGLDNLAEDPFLLDQVNMQNYLGAVTDSGTKLSPKDGVLAREFNDSWYVMLRLELTKEGAGLASKKNAVPLIYEKLLPLEKDGLSYVFYGSAFHGYKSSSSASKEISVISTVSLLAVVLILLFVFKSALPVLASLFSIFCSVLAAFCATHFVFGQIHMTALVFGTSLIGSCIDYSLHYFINWKTSKELDDSSKIRRHLFSGLILSLVSTELCFAFLFFAPFILLKQMAVFSFTGILSSFLTVCGFFTVFKLPPEHDRKIPFLSFWEEKLYPAIPSPLKKYAGQTVTVLIIAVSAFILSVNSDGLKIQNNISNLYKMEGRLKDDTVTAFQVLDYNPSSYLVLSAPSPEELLEKEEEISPLLPDRHICTSRFIPSVKMQKSSLESVKKLLPFASAQFENLGFDEETARDFKESVLSENDEFVTPEGDIPSSIKPVIKMLWPGEYGGKYYSIILPSGISDENFYRTLAESDENIFFENKVKDISSALDSLTRMVLVMFALAFVIIAFIMKFFYSWKDTLKIISIPVLSVLVTASVFVLSGLKIEFFGITGVILVFGLGLDYIIYKTQNKRNQTEAFAIALSFVTTAVSFGSLALSSFVPVHVIGLSIVSGLVTAFICAVL
jgi:predicted exporter